MRFSEKWGDSIDSAVELALQDLKLTRDQVTVTVLEEPSRGFFGLGSKLAKVRVEEKASEKPAAPVKAAEEAAAAAETAAPAERPAKAEKPQAKGERRNRRGRRQDRGDKPAERAAEKTEYTLSPEKLEEIRVLTERPEGLVLQEEHPAKAFLEEMVSKMGLNVTVTVYTGSECVFVDIDGPDTGTMIGKRGQTLDAVQYLTSLVVNKDQNDYIRVVVDAEGYRTKREKTLEKLALRLADKVARTRRTTKLEPMNPYERKVIHTVLMGRDDIVTRSEGDEPYRRVVIEAVKK